MYPTRHLLFNLEREQAREEGIKKVEDLDRKKLVSVTKDYLTEQTSNYLGRFIACNELNHIIAIHEAAKGLANMSKVTPGIDSIRADVEHLMKLAESNKSEYIVVTSVQ